MVKLNSMNYYKPIAEKVFRDCLIVIAIIIFVYLSQSDFAFEAVLLPIAIILIPLGIYFLLMTYVPLIKIHQNGFIEVRSEYGNTSKINLRDVSSIELISGLGGYEKVLSLSTKTDNLVKKLKIKVSYYSPSDIKSIISAIKKFRENSVFSMNKDLDTYIQEK